jgi:hypothetical protein
MKRREFIAAQAITSGGSITVAVRDGTTPRI